MNPSPHLPRSEAEFIAAIAEATLEKTRKEHRPGTVAGRALHSKSHGMVKARFAVRAGLPAELRVGLFATPGEFDALVRFSNGKGGAQRFDVLPNIRGLAVKVLGVPGTKALPGEENATEHDFLLANDPVSFAATIEQMFLVATGQLKKLRADHPRIFRLLLNSALKWVGNLLQLSYYSQVPYAFGERACKFALIPIDETPAAPLLSRLGRDYLRKAAERSLRSREVRFQFCVQLQQDAARESLEDSTVEWAGPYVPVADLTFLKVTQPIRESDGEELSFHPWRALKAHQPLGWPGRARLAAYTASFRWREQQNRPA